MAAIAQTTFSTRFAWIKLNQFVPKGPTDKKSALVEVMAKWQRGEKPLSVPMLTQFIDAYMLRKGDMSKLCSDKMRTNFRNFLTRHFMHFVYGYLAQECETSNISNFVNLHNSYPI